MSTTTEVTQMLAAWRAGDEVALDHLMARVHRELHRIARSEMARERQGHTLQPTALVNEAFLRLMGSSVSWQDRSHFFAVSTRVMRRILVDHARASRREKRGGDGVRIPLYEAEAEAVEEGEGVDILALESALEELERKDEKQCRILELCYFGGLSYPEIAEALGVSRATVGRELRFAKAWLRRRLGVGH